VSNIQVIERAIWDVQPAFNEVLVDRSINFEREAGFAIQALHGNDYALGIAMQNRQSVIDAVTNIAAIGISLNPAKKQAYLVPRDGRICLDISYMGLLDLAVDSGSIRWGQSRLVYQADTFEVQGVDREPIHRFSPFAKDRGDVVGVYCVVKTADGDYLTEAMSTDEVNEIRDRSSAWKAWIAKKKKCPWVTDWGEMAKKTVVKRASKYWPTTERLAAAVHHLNTDGGEGLANEETSLRDEWIEKARAAETREALTAIWKEAAPVFAAAKDAKGWDAFKAAAMERHNEIAVPAEAEQ
jgi:recombination protein RecT